MGRGLWSTILSSVSSGSFSHTTASLQACRYGASYLKQMYLYFYQLHRAFYIVLNSSYIYIVMVAKAYVWCWYWTYVHYMTIKAKKKVSVSTTRLQLFLPLTEETHEQKKNW